MYKSRIWKWGLDKKLKSDEVLAILILKTERDAQGRPCEFTIRGQPVDLDNINRYIRRNPSLVARFRAGEVPSIQTTLEVQCHAPSGSPESPRKKPSESKPVPAKAGEDDALVDEVLGLFKDYVGNCFANGIWDYEYNSFCRRQSQNDRSEGLFERVMASLALVNRSMMRKDDISISTVLNPAFEYLKEIILSESPVFVVRTACLLWYLDRNHKNDLLRIVMNYLADLVPIVLDPDNPMVRIWEILGNPGFSSYSTLALRLYPTLIPLMEERIGPANFLTAILYGDHIDCLLGHGRSAEALERATAYRARADATGLQHAWLIELAVAQTAVLCRAKEAEGNYAEAIECLRKLGDEYRMGDEQQAVVNVQLGNYSYRMDDFASAVQRFQEATRLAVAAGDADERLLATCLANLERALAKTGRDDEAAQVQMYRLSRLSRFARESSALASSSSTSTTSSSPSPWEQHQQQHQSQPLPQAQQPHQPQHQSQTPPAPDHSETSPSPVDSGLGEPIGESIDTAAAALDVPDWLWASPDVSLP